MNKRRLESLNLMKGLTPFTQLGILAPLDAKKMVDGYVRGDTTFLRKFIFSPDIPVSMNENLKMLTNFLG